MAITDGYTTLAALKPYLKIGASDTSRDDELERAIETASRAIDDYCGRTFTDVGSATAKTFVPDDPYRLWVPDFSTTTGLVVAQDTTGDGTFDTTWTLATDIQAEPLDRPNGYPYTSLVAVGTRQFPTGSRRALIEVTAQWGWASVPKPIEQACIIQAQVEYKRATEGAVPIVTMGGTTLGSSRFLDRDAERLIRGLSRLEVRAV